MLAADVYCFSDCLELSQPRKRALSEDLWNLHQLQNIIHESHNPYISPNTVPVADETRLHGVLSARGRLIGQHAMLAAGAQDQDATLAAAAAGLQQGAALVAWPGPLQGEASATRTQGALDDILAVCAPAQGAAHVSQSLLQDATPKAPRVPLELMLPEMEQLLLGDDDCHALINNDLFVEDYHDNPANYAPFPHELRKDCATVVSEAARVPLMIPEMEQLLLGDDDCRALINNDLFVDDYVVHDNPTNYDPFQHERQKDCATVVSEVARVPLTIAEIEQLLLGDDDCQAVINSDRSVGDCHNNPDSYAPFQHELLKDSATAVLEAVRVPLMIPEMEQLLLGDDNCHALINNDLFVDDYVVRDNPTNYDPFQHELQKDCATLVSEVVRVPLTIEEIEQLHLGDDDCQAVINSDRSVDDCHNNPDSYAPFQHELLKDCATAVSEAARVPLMIPEMEQLLLGDDDCHALINNDLFVDDYVIRDNPTNYDPFQHELQKDCATVVSEVARGPSIPAEIEKLLLVDDDCQAVINSDRSGDDCHNNLDSYAPFQQELLKDCTTVVSETTRVPLTLAEIEQLLLGDDDCQSLINNDCSADDCHNNPDSYAPFQHELLKDCATAVLEGNFETAKGILAELSPVASLYSIDHMQRLTAYFCNALRSRIHCQSEQSQALVTKPRTIQSFEAILSMQALYRTTYYMLGHMAANSVIIETFKNEKKIHIVDLDIGHGTQWISLIQAFSTRPVGPPQLRITGVPGPKLMAYKGGVHIIGRRLEDFAKNLNVQLEFCPLEIDVVKLQEPMIERRAGEALAVNMAFQLHRVPDESVCITNPRDRLLRMVHALGPKVVTLVELEANTNSSLFLPRFTEALDKYVALFESIHAPPPNPPTRRESNTGNDPYYIEEHCLAESILSVVAYEGAERIERYEWFGKWSTCMGMAGFNVCPTTPFISKTMKNTVHKCQGKYFLTEENGAIHIGWNNTVLVVSSAWKAKQ